ncbi:hypothetical protein Tsp_00124 [Trichinella spiralis]|uniref:hypothetical protein n=1 Tax=Trichinella spiralis TaxID=6334 RepID=UPI0001EFC02D|nr:hypothetical protein Tsp_00124 [Trichinella spiralis]
MCVEQNTSTTTTTNTTVSAALNKRDILVMYSFICALAGFTNALAAVQLLNVCWEKKFETFIFTCALKLHQSKHIQNTIICSLSSAICGNAIMIADIIKSQSSCWKYCTTRLMCIITQPQIWILSLCEPISTAAIEVISSNVYLANYSIQAFVGYISGALFLTAVMKLHLKKMESQSVQLIRLKREKAWNSDYLITDYPITDYPITDYLSTFYARYTYYYKGKGFEFEAKTKLKNKNFKSCKERVNIRCCANATDCDRLQLLLAGISIASTI